ncbi:toll/interleukin-1 receptor domain-containing protein [Rhodoblastus sp.]|uniref:toll/interleukin-1 receptor domain-containing protein n=1 Tax=Rhodoblastus sp. TaxID=1962975 RepID=UPI003F9A2DF7
MTETNPDMFIIGHYRQWIERLHPKEASIWPLISGYNCRIGSFKGWLVIIFTHTGNTGFVESNGVGELSDALIGANSIDESNREIVRSKIETHFMLQPRDGVVFIEHNSKLSHSELVALTYRHELALGLAPMKIFLSHKGFDKPLVRKFKTTLVLLGFDPWLDEDNMPAGTKLERGILKGFDDSCAAVFFVTPQFKDEDFIASEVDYAIEQKRKKGDKFSIITLVFGDGAAKGKVPDLLHGYVWKEPKSELEALQEIIRALPIHVGYVRWR